MDLGALIAANADKVHPAPEGVLPIDGGVLAQVEKGESVRVDDAGNVQRDGTDALVSALKSLVKPEKDKYEVGGDIPMEGEHAPQAAASEAPAPTPTPDAPTAPVPATERPSAPEMQGDVLSLANQLAEARTRLAQAEQQAQQHAARLQQIEPHYAAIMQKMPEIQGIQQKYREAEEKIALTEARTKYIQDSYAAGQTPDLAAFEQQHRMNKLLERAANIDKVVEEKFGGMLNERDQRYQQNLEQQQAANFAQQTKQTFEAGFAAVENAVPALKGFKSRDAIKQAVANQWYEASVKAGQYLPIDQFVAPFIADYRAQAVAVAAPQKTRAEVQAAMPVTNSGGSGTRASEPGKSRPANWDKMTVREKLTHSYANTGR